MSPMTFAPRGALLDHFRQGWRLVAGHQYVRNDWAILLEKPDTSDASEADFQRWARLFAKQPREVRSNLSAAASSRFRLVQEGRFARRLNRLDWQVQA